MAPPCGAGNPSFVHHDAVDTSIRLPEELSCQTYYFYVYLFAMFDFADTKSRERCALPACDDAMHL
jgi:hypothetical protein